MSSCSSRLDVRKNFQEGGVEGCETGKEGGLWNLLFG